MKPFEILRLKVIPVAFALFSFLAASRECFGQSLHVAQEGASEKSGVLAYLTVDGKRQQVTAVRCSSNTVQVLFTKNVSNEVVLPPICMSNAVVTVSVDGVVTKYGLDGVQIFCNR